MTDLQQAQKEINRLRAVVREMCENKYYVLHTFGDVFQELHGPYHTTQERYKKAESIYLNRPDDGIYFVDMTEGELSNVVTFEYQTTEDQIL